MTKRTTEKVRITLYASRLKNVAGMMKGTSDPYAVLTLLPNNPNEKPVLVGKTEVVKNSLSPRWTTAIELDYEIGALTRFNVGIYDEIRKAKTNKPMGSAMFEVGEILGSKGNVKAKKLRQGGTLFCRVTSAPKKSHGTFHLGLRGVGLRNVDGVFSKSDPFIEVSSKIETPGGLTWQPIYRTKHINNDLNPVWPAFSLDMYRLCKGDTKQPILVSCYDWEKSGKHQSMGQFETTVDALLAAKTPGGSGPPKQVNTSKAFHLKKPRGKRDYGKIVVTTALVEGDDKDREEEALGNLTPVPVPAYVPPAQSDKPTFVDYLSGGCELQLSIAIDFTGSNGDPRKPGTLHYIHRDGQLNDYEKAFSAIGEILGRYDSDQKFPIYGFGAKYGGVVRHCFQVGSKPEASGMGEAMEFYRSVFRSGLTMSGPTVLSECIQMAAARATSAQQEAEKIGQQSYGILLILTDGSVTDIELTKRTLRQVSDSPLSIVIVGVGNADFSKMQFLDDFADADPNQRDIVQFVPFNKFRYDKSALTSETLDEIPDQLVDYFYTHRGIKPLPPIHGSQISINASLADDEDIDLSIDYNEEDEIVLGDTPAAYCYDDTQYGTAAAVMVPPVPVPASTAPYRPASDPPTASMTQPRASATPAFSGALDAPPPVAQPSVFHVAVPHGVVAGQQLEVQNPKTHQHMIVTVPNGVPPGGKFAVAY